MSGLVDQVVTQVSGWVGVTSGPHRFGGVEFLLEGREIGHVHPGGLVDIAFSRVLRDQLVGEALAHEHHIYADSSWTSFYVRSDTDVPQALVLLRLSYLRHYLLLNRRLLRRANLPMLNIAEELAKLPLSPAVCDIFDSLLSGEGDPDEAAYS
jgi:hypothetical protein